MIVAGLVLLAVAAVLTWAVEIATKRALLHDKVHRGGKVWFFCLEDDRDEANRRLVACLRHHGLDRNALARIGQYSENHAVVAPTGIMDQSTSLLG